MKKLKSIHQFKRKLKKFKKTRKFKIYRLQIKIKKEKLYKKEIK